MSGVFEYEYPLFIIAERVVEDLEQPTAITFHGLLTLTAANGRTDALALFTDQLGAEQFRDENVLGRKVFKIASADKLVAVLQFVRQVASAVAFDPYRIDYSTPTLSIEDFLRQLPAPPGSPAQDTPEA